MHILFLLLIIAIIGLYILKQSNNNNSNENSQIKLVNSDLFSATQLAWLSKGKLFLRHGSETVKQVNSPYIQNLIDKNEERQQRHAWKQDTSWGTTATGNLRQFKKDNIGINFTAARFLSEGKLLYFLEGEGFGGLFRYDPVSGEELRLSHRQNLSYRDLNYDAERKQILCASGFANGVSNIVIMDENGDSSRELTGGDTVDSSPDWVDNHSSQIVYQSQGLARSTEGYIMAYGPASIQLLDQDKGEITAVLENDKFDYLQPRVAKNGDLYFIRRPFEMPSYKANNFVLDTLMFPFRLLRAVFHYLNFFSLMYSKQPLTSASSPYVEADLKEMVLQGKRIDAEKALKKAGKVMGVRSLVPKDWVLVRKDRYGNETVLAHSVAAFQFSHDGNIIYSNGFGVFGLDDSGQTGLLVRDELISDIVV